LDQEARDQADARVSRIRAFGAALLCAKVALLPGVFDYSLDVPFTVAKSLLSHALAYALGAVMIGLLIRFGRSFFVWSWVHVPVALFLIANIAAAVFAADPVLALYGAHSRMLGLGTIADWVVVYFAVVLLVRTRAEAAAVIACALVASLFVLAYELVQTLGRDPLSWDQDVVTRPISTIGQATSLAQYLTILAVGAVGLALHVRGIRRAVRALVMVLAALLLAGAGATGTRSAALGVVTGSTLLVLAIWLRHPSPRARMLALATAGLASAAMAALLLLTPLGSRITAATSSQTVSADDNMLARIEPATETRVALYQIAVAMVRDRPILGYGPDNFAVGVPRFRTETEPSEIRQSLATSAHSWLAYAGTGSGVIGLAAFVAIAVVALSMALRESFRPLALVGAGMLAAFLGTGLTTINEISTDWLFWAAAGMVAAATARPSRSIDALRSRRPSGAVRESKRLGDSFRHVAPLLCVVMGLSLSLTVINAWDAARLTRSAELLRLQGHAREAVDLALRATRSDPGRAEYWHGLGLAYISASRWADASAAFDRARKLAPYDVRNAGDFARAQVILASSGDGNARTKATELADEAVRVDPNNPLAQLTRAVVMQVSGNLPEATRSVERALALDPASTNDVLYVTATQIYSDSGRASDAVRVARRGLGVLGGTAVSVPLRYELARALVASSQPSDALTELDIALSIQPGYAPAEQLRSEIRTTIQK
jgi:O-antigen ligase/tetratricopeptide (TPR) repeat protein